MTVRPGGHEFILGDNIRLGSDGRQFRLCAECGQSRRASPHQRPDPRSRKPAPEQAPPKREVREVAMLRLALDAALELPDLGYTLRRRAHETRQALDLPPDVAPAPVVISGALPSPTTRRSRKGEARWVRRSIRGAYWEIAEAALDQGYIAERTGDGHIRFIRGQRSFSLSTTVREGRGHGFENARAAARRAGVEF